VGSGVAVGGGGSVGGGAWVSVGAAATSSRSAGAQPPTAECGKQTQHGEQSDGWRVHTFLLLFGLLRRELSASFWQLDSRASLLEAR
jgi:hypothetical protein